MRQDIGLEPVQITQLADNINETIASLTNIDSILTETRDDLNAALVLKIRASDAKYAFHLILYIFIFLNFTHIF